MKKLNLVPGLALHPAKDLSTSLLRPQFKLGTKLSQFEVPEVEELIALTSEPTYERDVHLSAVRTVVNELFLLSLFLVANFSLRIRSSHSGRAK